MLGVSILPRSTISLLNFELFAETMLHFWLSIYVVKFVDVSVTMYVVVSSIGIPEAVCEPLYNWCQDRGYER